MQLHRSVHCYSEISESIPSTLLVVDFNEHDVVRLERKTVAYRYIKTSSTNEYDSIATAEHRQTKVFDLNSAQV